MSRSIDTREYTNSPKLTLGKRTYGEELQVASSPKRQPPIVLPNRKEEISSALELAGIKNTENNDPCADLASKDFGAEVDALDFEIDPYDEDEYADF